MYPSCLFNNLLFSLTVTDPYLIHRINIGNSKTSLLNLTCKGKVTHFKEVERGVNKQPLLTVSVNLGDWEYQNSR